MAAKKKPEDQLGVTDSWGSRIWSALGGGGPDPTNIKSHPDYKIKYTKDRVSSGSKIIDEARGSTVLGDPIREIDRTATDAANAPATTKPRGPKKVKRSTTVTTAPAASTSVAKTRSPNTGVQSWRVGGSVPGKTLIDPGTRFAATSRQIKPKQKAHAGLAAQGAKHHTGGLKWFRGKD